MQLQVQIESLKNDIYASKPLNLWALSYKCWLSYQKDKIYGSAFKFSTLSSFKCNMKGWKMFQVIVIRFSTLARTLYFPCDSCIKQKYQPGYINICQTIIYPTCITCLSTFYTLFLEWLGACLLSRHLVHIQ